MDEEILTLRQSPASHLLGAALGCAVSLLLFLMRQPWVGGFVLVASAGWAIFLLEHRTRVVLTQTRVVVQGIFGERAAEMRRIVEVRLTREAFAQTMTLILDEGRPFRVKDLQNAEPAVPVVKSLAKRAREPDWHPDEEAPRRARAADEILRMAGRVTEPDEQAHVKHVARPIDLGRR